MQKYLVAPIVLIVSVVLIMVAGTLFLIFSCYSRNLPFYEGETLDMVHNAVAILFILGADNAVIELLMTSASVRTFALIYVKLQCNINFLLSKYIRIKG